jgi:hypothetical protein
MIIAREYFTTPKTGPCGILRSYNTYPIGFFADIDQFKSDAMKIINDFYKKSYEGGDDIFGLEYFETDISANDIDNNIIIKKSLYRIVYARIIKKWVYSENGEYIESFDKTEVLFDIWKK